MSGEIKVGVLVAVVRPSACRGIADGIGHMFTVKEVNAIYPRDRCGNCGQRHHSQNGSLVAFDGKDWWPLSRLKRIDPPAVPESTETREEIPA